MRITILFILTITLVLAGCSTPAPAPAPSPAPPSAPTTPGQNAASPLSNPKLRSDTDSPVRTQAASAIKLIVNGLGASTPPIIRNSSTYVPVRAAGEMLNKVVTWDAATKTVYINDKQQTLTKPSSKTLKLIVNGKQASTVPIILSSTTYVPVRAAGEMLKKIVNWASATKTVYITDRQYDIVLNFPVSRYPETAAHIKFAIKRGETPVCTIDRAGADENREQSLAGIPTKEGYDRDEFPMAMCAEGGAGADVAYVQSSDNRGAGSWVGSFLQPRPDGTRVLFVIDATTATGAPKPTTPTQPSNVYYKNCAAAKAAGAAPLYKGQPGYSTSLDGDKDGVACES